MKFVRFGSMSPQKQKHYKEPEKNMWPSSPPCRKGFFAFPAGYMDPFYLPLSRPPENPHSLLQYLRDENGAKLTKNDLFCENPLSRLDHEEYLRLGAIKAREEGISLADSLDELLSMCDETVLSPKGQAILKKRKLKMKQIMWVKRPSYVMVFPNPNRDLTFYGLGTQKEDRSRLNQPLKPLLDPCGEKIDADYFFYCAFRESFPNNYEGGYHAPEPEEDFDDLKDLYDSDGKSIPIPKWLKMNHVKPEQLCIWPCYRYREDEYAATLKRYRVFDYDGCLWHHLGMYLKRSEILSQFSDTWYYTDMHAYERALRKSDGREFRKNMKYQRQMTRPGYFGAYTYNGTIDQSTMYEVFFDEKIS